jgi:hypothetical protein
LVDGVIVWTNDGSDGRDLYWVGAGDIAIGTSMDGSGSNQPFLDNLTIGKVTNSALPTTMSYFEAEEIKNKFIELSWETTSEINNDYFTIEKSLDGQEWTELMIVTGAGNSNNTKYYNSIDYNPYMGISFYRLKQTDFNGKFTYSITSSVNILNKNDDNILIYPNPAKGIITIESNLKLGSEILIFNNLGQNITEQLNFISSSNNSQTIDLSSVPKGIYYLKSGTKTQQIIKN